MSVSRRGFMAASATFTALTGGASILPGLRSVSAAEARLSEGVVQLRPEIEPLVQLIENTERGKLLEEIGRRIRNGLSYREVLAALLLAGVRNVEPRPAVGFKFHAVLVVNSAHIASLAAPDQDRWLPILWAIDEFKSSQARDVEEGNWTMPPVDESRIPVGSALRDSFHKSMTNWDEGLADVSAAGVARQFGAGETLELFAAYAARDFRSIGHKPIFLANAWRTLQTIGWEHAEPILRSLAYAMLNHNGEPNPAGNDLAPDRSWKANSALMVNVRADWEHGRVDDGAVRELLAVLHTGTPEEAARSVVEQLNSGIGPQSIFNSLHLAAGELLMRQSGIVSLHASTTTNAMRFLFDHVSTPSTRLALLLQNAAFLPQFREAMKSRGSVSADRILDLEPAENPAAITLEAIFNDVGKSRISAGRQVLSWLNAGNAAGSLADAARRLVFLKGNDSHDYKFSSAVLEDCLKLTPEYRNRFLAASTWMLKGSSFPTNSLVERIRSALN
jgi:hypothetical protein